MAITDTSQAQIRLPVPREGKALLDILEGQAEIAAVRTQLAVLREVAREMEVRVEQQQSFHTAQ